MKIYKSSVFFMIMIPFFVNASPESDKIAQKLSNAASKAFGSFRMFSKPIDETGIIEWNNIIIEGLALVQMANKNSQKSQNYSKRIIDSNNDLTNTIKLAYNVIFLPYENKDKLSGHDSKIILNEKNKFITIFTKIKNDMANVIKKVNNKRLFKSSIAEKDILIEIATKISDYADNAMSSIDFRLSTENKISADTTRPWVGRM